MSATSATTRTRAAAAPVTKPAAPALQIQPYLFYNGRAEEAIEFYQRELGAEKVMLMRYRESPEPPPPGSMPPGTEDKVMHAEIRIGGNAVLISDGHCDAQGKFENFALTLVVATVAEAQRRFAALSKGGKVLMPLGKTFFSPQFGMVADKFGVMWMVLVTPPQT